MRNEGILPLLDLKRRGRKEGKEKWTSWRNNLTNSDAISLNTKKEEKKNKKRKDKQERSQRKQWWTQKTSQYLSIFHRTSKNLLFLHSLWNWKIMNFVLFLSTISNRILNGYFAYLIQASNWKNLKKILEMAGKIKKNKECDL